MAHPHAQLSRANPRRPRCAGDRDTESRAHPRPVPSPRAYRRRGAQRPSRGRSSPCASASRGRSVAVAIVATLAVDGHGSSRIAAEHRIDRAVGALLAGIPQQGSTLGKRSAPITLEVFNNLEGPRLALVRSSTTCPDHRGLRAYGSSPASVPLLARPTPSGRRSSSNSRPPRSPRRAEQLWNSSTSSTSRASTEQLRHGKLLDNIAHQVPAEPGPVARRPTKRPPRNSSVAEDHAARASGSTSPPRFASAQPAAGDRKTSWAGTRSGSWAEALDRSHRSL